MKALIDADWFAYSFGNATDAEYKILAWPFVKSRVDGTLRKILEAVGATEHQLYITSNDKSNFRFKAATIKPYKGSRPSDKPHYYDKIREYLLKGKGAIEVFDMEADDIVSIELYKDFLECGGDMDGAKVVLCTIDKDLNNTPGYHYNWMKATDGVYWVGKTEALQNFYCQLLTGDTVDNIPGLFGVGKSSKLLKDVKALDSELDMYTLVRKQYEQRFGSYCEKFLAENAQLLWMLREIDYIPREMEVVHRLYKLEDKRLSAFKQEEKEDG